MGCNTNKRRRRPALLCNIFPHYLINITIFEKKLLNLKCVFQISLQPLSQIFCIIRRIELDIINIHLSSCKVPLFFRILMALEFSQQNLEKSSDIKFHENPSSVSRVVPCGWTDVAFRHFANAPD